MRAAYLIVAVLSLAGCSDAEEKKQAMRLFVKSCAVPVSVQLTLSNNFWGGNSVSMTCTDYKEKKDAP